MQVFKIEGLEEEFSGHREALSEFVLQEEKKQSAIITDAPRPVIGVRVGRQWIHPVEEPKGRNF